MFTRIPFNKLQYNSKHFIQNSQFLTAALITWCQVFITQTCNRDRKFLVTYNIRCGSGYLSRYSDSLRAGRSGDRIPVEARFSAPAQTGPGAHPASCTMGTGSFPGVKRPGRGIDHPPPSSAEVKERVELYFYSPSGPSRPLYRVNFTLTFTHKIREEFLPIIPCVLLLFSYIPWRTLTHSLVVLRQGAPLCPWMFNWRRNKA
jgi:hypothetical protein